MIPFDPHRVLLNARQATTEDLLDRITAFREGMEPEAIAIIEMELRRRGVDPAQTEQLHREREGKILRDRTDLALRCSFCSRPAIARRWGWHRLRGRIPLFPRLLNYCADHQPT